MSHVKGLGLPYMGSKRKLASRIIDKIIEDNPKVKHFYDLFGGGGSMSFEALQRSEFKTVTYNEFNTGVVELLKKIKNDGIDKDFYTWIDRETFHKYKTKECWKGGLIKVCWSFGNDQTSYLFSEQNELLKKPLHNIVVNDKGYKKFKKITGLKIPKSLFDPNKTINQRRLEIMKFVKAERGRTDLQQLERLQQLEQLQQLERLQQLELSNESFENVLIVTKKKKTIIYLDPPYKGTRKYEKDINHDKLKEFIHKSKYKIYVSGYNNDYDLKEIASFDHRSLMSAQKSPKAVVERLFTNE